VRRVIDTTILIRHLRGDSRATELLESFGLAGDELWGATVTRTEVLVGMQPAQADATYDVFGLLRWMQISAAVADLAGTMAQRFRRSHQGVDLVDYLVAAVTIELGAQLVTLNVRRFPMFPNLQPPYRLNEPDMQEDAL
jgi:predicted nucleic acid-binding protein